MSFLFFFIIKDVLIEETNEVVFVVSLKHLLRGCDKFGVSGLQSKVYNFSPDDHKQHQVLEHIHEVELPFMVSHWKADLLQVFSLL
jgi:hypothetical protein